MDFLLAGSPSAGKLQSPFGLEDNEYTSAQLQRELDLQSLGAITGLRDMRAGPSSHLPFLYSSLRMYAAKLK